MSYFCYIVLCADGTLYTGITTELQRRVKEHNSGKGAAYTRQHGPVSLVYAEPQPDRGSATKREAQIKSYAKPRKLKMIAEMEPGALEAMVSKPKTKADNKTNPKEDTTAVDS